MQTLTFHPVVGEIGAQVVALGLGSVEAGRQAEMSITNLVPAGADEVSMQAITAFHAEAAALLELNRAAQEELMRAGAAFTEIARTYADVDAAAANSVLLAATPLSNSWLQ